MNRISKKVKVINFNHTYELAERETMINIYDGIVHMESNRDLNNIISKFEEFIYEVEVNEGKIIKVFAKIPVERFKMGLTNITSSRLNNLRKGPIIEEKALKEK